MIAIAFTLPITIMCVKSHAQDISLRNNILYDATLSPNIGVEYGIDSLWTVGMDAGIQIFPRSKKVSKKWRHILIAPEVRRYFTEGRVGHFVGANILYTHYNIVGVTFPFGMYRSVRHKRKQGNAVAIGPQYGYVWQFANRWKIEAECGVDVGYQRSHEYSQKHPSERIGTDNGFFVMPRLGINIVYRLKK